MNKYVGIIELYYETGMEGHHAALFHSDTGNREGPKWDNPEETMIYRSLDHSIWLGKKNKYNVKIYNKEGTEVEYEGPLTYSRERVKEKNYILTFVPKEVDFKTFVKWLTDERKCELETDACLVHEEDWHKEYYSELRAKKEDK